MVIQIDLISIVEALFLLSIPAFVIYLASKQHDNKKCTGKKVLK